MFDKKLRLLTTSACNRNCSGCCNKDWDVDNLPLCTDYNGYDMIMLTGGEPLLFVDDLRRLVYAIRCVTSAPIIVYTAYPQRVMDIIDVVDGITLTVHKQSDVSDVSDLSYELMEYLKRYQKSLRLNVFEKITVPSFLMNIWRMKTGIKWIENCPLPENEVLMRAYDRVGPVV